MPPLHSQHMDSFLESLLGWTSSQLCQELERILQRHTSHTSRFQLLLACSVLASQLHDASDRLMRQYATCHNAIVWPLTQDLTLKVFSTLGIHSLCQAAATCTMFHRLAMEPACYSNVDLTERGLKVNDRTVANFIRRAGQQLRSLKLGSLLKQQSKFDNGSHYCYSHTLNKALSYAQVLNLSKSCLKPLINDNGLAGSLLRTLHLFNIEEMDIKHLSQALTVCPLLMEFKAIGLHVNCRSVLQSIASHCHMLKRLCLQSPKDGLSFIIKAASCCHLVKGCPSLLSLSLRGFKLIDESVKILLKGLQCLKEVDFSGTDLLTGTFLRGLASFENQRLESLILRDCIQLREVEVEQLLFALSSGDCKSLRYLDISNKHGLAATAWFERRLSARLEAVSRVREDRPELELMADFPDEKCDSESVSIASGFGDSDESNPLPTSYQTSDSTTDDSNLSSSGINDDDDDNDISFDDNSFDDNNHYDNTEDDDVEYEFL